jgi:hypothetical protein
LIYIKVLEIKGKNVPARILGGICDRPGEVRCGMDKPGYPQVFT